MRLPKKVRLEQDRAALLVSYDEMVRTFRVRRRDRVTRAQFATMSNGQIMQVCKDLYNNAPLRLAKRLERKALRVPKEPLKRRIRLAVLRLIARVRLVYLRRPHVATH